jgi:hypothetical protein
MVTLFEEVAAERIRQNEKHPVNPRHLYDYKVTGCELEHIQWYNDTLEKNGNHNYRSLIEEEVLEVFTAETREERHAEIVQAIALLVRLDEDTEI